MIHLSVHSNYSFLVGAARIEELIDRAKKFRMPALALTDINGMYGLIDFAKAAAENGIKPILGTQIDDKNNSKQKVVLLAKNRNGYSKICRLITVRKLDENFSLVDSIKNEILTGADDLFILSSSFEFLRNLKSEIDVSKAKNLFVELFLPSKKSEHYHKQRKVVRELFNFARANNLPVVATNQVYFINKEDYLLHKVLLAIKFNTTLTFVDFVIQKYLKEDENDLKAAKQLNHVKKIKDKFYEQHNQLVKEILNSVANEEQYFKSTDEMWEIWRGLPEAIENTIRISNECNVDLKFGEYKHPKFPLPHSETSFSYLWKIAFRGLEEKYKPITEQAVNRLQEELSVIQQLGFADYFLIVWDIAQQAKRMNMMMLGRGSAANSIVAYCLGLTQVDPLEHNLFFERFLNLGRASPPDIDLDFSWKERDAIVKYVFDKYGKDYVAMISTTVTFRARSAFREVAKVFGLSDGEISEYSQFIPWTSAENLPLLAEKFPESKKLRFDSEPLKTIVQIASKLSGFPHHLSIHPGGIVISPEPITNFVALEFAENKGLGLIITQPDMYPIEDLGLVKIDLLSQRSLAVVKDTMRKIRNGF